MPLHLLGKKSWNVYNTENIDRVRRDEATAKAAERESEQDRKEHDAEQRWQALRRGTEDSLDTAQEITDVQNPNGGRKRKHREISELPFQDREQNISHRHSSRSPDQRPRYRERKEHGQQLNRQPDLESISNMKFKDAAGRHASSQRPWYLDSLDASGKQQQSSNTDVWGNEDPSRMDREKARMAANDPLLSMKRGVRQLRDAESQRQEWKKQREADLHEVEFLARRHERHRKKRHDNGSEHEPGRRERHKRRHHSSRSERHRDKEKYIDGLQA